MTEDHPWAQRRASHAFYITLKAILWSHDWPFYGQWEGDLRASESKSFAQSHTKILVLFPFVLEYTLRC